MTVVSHVSQRACRRKFRNKDVPARRIARTPVVSSLKCASRDGQLVGLRETGDINISGPIHSHAAYPIVAGASEIGGITQGRVDDQAAAVVVRPRSEEHTSELQSLRHL